MFAESHRSKMYCMACSHFVSNFDFCLAHIARVLFARVLLLSFDGLPTCARTTCARRLTRPRLRRHFSSSSTSLCAPISAQAIPLVLLGTLALHSGECIYTNLLNLPEETLGKDFPMADVRERITEPASDSSGQSASSGQDDMSLYDGPEDRPARDLEQIEGMIESLQLATEIEECMMCGEVKQKRVLPCSQNHQLCRECLFNRWKLVSKEEFSCPYCRVDVSGAIGSRAADPGRRGRCTMACPLRKPAGITPQQRRLHLSKR